MLVRITSEDGVGPGIAVRMGFPTAVDEGVGALGCDNGVHHDVVVAACRILHAYGNFDSAGGQPVLLVLDGSGSDSDVAQDIVQIFVVLRIEHLVGKDETGLLNSMHVQVTGCQDSLVQIRFACRIRLVDKTFVALACRTGLVCIDSGDNHYLVTDLLLNRNKTGHVVHDSVFVVCRAGADDQNQAVGATLEDVDELSPLPGNCSQDAVCRRILSFHF